MSTEQKTPAPASPKKSLPLPAVIAVLVVAVVAVLYVFVWPMISGGGGDEMAGIPPATAPVPATPEANSPATPPTAATPGTPPSPTGAVAPSPGTVPPSTTAPAAPGAKPAPQPGSAITLSPKAGEIVVEGTIKKLSPSDGGFVMQVTGITLPGQGPITLSPPREKTVVPNSPAAITQGGQPAKLGALKTGARVSAVGPNKGKGTTLRARQIQL